MDGYGHHVTAALVYFLTNVRLTVTTYGGYKERVQAERLKSVKTFL